MSHALWICPLSLSADSQPNHEVCLQLFSALCPLDTVLLHSPSSGTLRHHSQGPERVFVIIRLDAGRPGRARCSTNLSKRALLVEGSSLPGKLVTIALSHSYFEELGYRGRNLSLWSLFLPHEDFSSSFGSELCIGKAIGSSPKPGACSYVSCNCSSV